MKRDLAGVENESEGCGVWRRVAETALNLSEMGSVTKKKGNKKSTS